MVHFKNSHKNHEDLTNDGVLKHNGDIKYKNVTKFNCPPCNQKFYEIEEMEKHQEAEHTQYFHEKQVVMRKKYKSRTCSICWKICSAPEKLKIHMATHTNTPVVTCEVCGKGFSTKHAYERHMMIHRNEFPHQCKICKKGFRRHDKVMDHCLRIHKEYYQVLMHAKGIESLHKEV